MLLPETKIHRVHQNGARHYKVEGQEEPFPSVTTVLGVISKPALIPWAKNISLEKVRASLLDRTAANSIARSLLEPRIVTRLETGWRIVLERQRFALSAPGRNGPLIDTALLALPKFGIRKTRTLFEAAAAAVGIQLSPNWTDFLARLEGRGPEAAI